MVPVILASSFVTPRSTLFQAKRRSLQEDLVPRYSPLALAEDEFRTQKEDDGQQAMDKQIR